ncbi:hypothetical protein [Consotaella aegiceratis]|uniref:hypothetical protein n=1 Tax=Consotaella aegiceratis TaxID=3097961 RepID=UPI002F427A2E
MKLRDRAEMEENPVRTATAAMGMSVSTMSRRAARSRSARWKAPGPCPVSRANAASNNADRLDAWLDGVTTFDGEPGLETAKAELGPYACEQGSRGLRGNPY